MATDQKTVYRSFSYLRCDDFAAYLEDMAAKGWHLESWGAGLKFRRGEPEQATYAVEVFSDATEYDTRPEPSTKEFADYCEAAGWQMVDAKRKFVIFKKLRPDAHPIMTDAERLEAVVKEERKTVLRQLMISGVWCLTRWGDFFGSGFTRDIFLYESMLIQVFWAALFLASAWNFLGLMVWKRRTEKRIAEGQMLHLGKGGSFQARAYNVVLAIMLPLLLGTMAVNGETGPLMYLAVMVGVLWLMAYLIAQKRPDAATNQIIQTLVSIGLVLVLFLFAFGSAIRDPEPELAVKVPLLAEDLGCEPMEITNAHMEEDATIFGSVRWYSIQSRDETLYYAVYESDFDWVLDRIWAVETDASNWEVGDPAPWGAEEVRTRFSEAYVVRWENWILTFNGVGGESLTEEQIGTILAALAP